MNRRDRQTLFFSGVAAAVLAAILGSASRANAAEALGLEGFLRQVEAGNDGLKGARASAEGGISRSEEGDLQFMPYLSLSAQYSGDSRETLSPSFLGTETVTKTYTLGISQLTPIGLSAKLGYTLSTTALDGVSPALVPQSSYSDARPTLELSFPIWRNLFGSENRANRDLVNAQAEAAGHGARFESVQILSQAETAYWRLAAARETVTTQSEALEASLRVRNWNSDRVKRQLADEAELLQAEAALAARRMELQSAKDEEHASARAFNSFRGQEGEFVPESLGLPDARGLDKLGPPPRVEARADVLAARAKEKIASASARVGAEKNKPVLEAYATLSRNGRDASSSEAVGESFGGSHPWTVVGVRFGMTFDVWGAGRARSGYHLDREGARLSYERKLQEQARDWDDFSRKFDDARRRATLAFALEEAQRRKLEHERDRLRRGRTTTFQVLIFEQDYANARLSRIRAQSEALTTLAQLKTFSEGGAL
ncbi:MAG: TolC family protein [Bdellovibrionales bacterium]|nr:TolC family protein [Bdellovibrionales bacterium]